VIGNDADRLDFGACVLFAAGIVAGSAWFYWSVMCSAQRLM
jgi:hypothetical protein